MTAIPGTVTFEVSGRRYIVSRNEEEKQQWLASQDKYKRLRAEARVVADFITNALSYEGLDKLMMSSDGDITVINDGATILKNMDIVEIQKLICQYEKSRNKVFKYPTGLEIVFIKTVYKILLCTGYRPIRIADVFELAARD